MSRYRRPVFGFDFGTRQIGIAVLQPPMDFATPLTVLRARAGTPDWPAIEALLKEWRPQLCVVGLPLNMDGSNSELADKARRFSRQLQGRYAQSLDFEVQLQDERLSTREAKDLLRDQQASSRPADSLAAKVILESWVSRN